MRVVVISKPFQSLQTIKIQGFSEEEAKDMISTAEHWIQICLKAKNQLKKVSLLGEKQFQFCVHIKPGSLIITRNG